MKKKILIYFLLWSLNSTAQISYEGDYYYGGICYNHYVYGLTPFEIYAYDVNHLASVTNKHGRFNYMPGILIGFNTDGEHLQGKYEYSFNRRVSSASYSAINLSDSTIFTVDEKLKTTYGYIKIGGAVPVKRFSFGASIDLGIFNNRIKRKGGNYSGKWTKYLTQTGLTNDYRARSFTAGVSLSASFLLTNTIQIGVSRQFMMLDADFNTKNLQDYNINVQHFQFSICYLFR